MVEPIWKYLPGSKLAITTNQSTNNQKVAIFWNDKMSLRPHDQFDEMLITLSGGANLHGRVHHLESQMWPTSQPLHNTTPSTQACDSQRVPGDLRGTPGPPWYNPNSGGHYIWP